MSFNNFYRQAQKKRANERAKKQRALALQRAQQKALEPLTAVSTNIALVTSQVRLERLAFEYEQTHQ